jgi:hypothetical protein
MPTKASPEFPAEVDAFVARQMQVPASELGFYEWSGRTIEYHRAQIRDHLRFRVCGVEDAAKLTDWLAVHVAHAERNPGRVRQEMLARCREVRAEPSAPARVTRMVRSALSMAEDAWFTRIETRCGQEVCARILVLITPEDDDPDGEHEDEPAAEAGDGTGVLFPSINDDAGERGPVVDAGRDRQAAGGPRDRPACGVVRRCRTEGGLPVVGPGRGGVTITPAAPFAGVGGDGAGGAAGRAGTGDHRQPGGSAAGHGAPDRGPRGAEGHPGDGERVQAG